MRSGCAGAAVVEAKKDRYANDAAPKSPKIPLMPHHLHLQEFCVKLGQNGVNHSNFAPVDFLVGDNIILDLPPNVRRFALSYYNVSS
jgi:hypothetical protein